MLFHQNLTLPPIVVKELISQWLTDIDIAKIEISISNKNNINFIKRFYSGIMYNSLIWNKNFNSRLTWIRKRNFKYDTIIVSILIKKIRTI